MALGCNPHSLPRRSLLEDGSDAVVYGLSQRAQNSAEEWFKRAKSLMERGSPGLAANVRCALLITIVCY
jgi:hypothetical protein